MNRTLVICKPDAVERALVGEIVGRIEAKGLRLDAAELRTIGPETAAVHYAEHVGKPFYEALMRFITRGPSMVLVVSGADGTPEVVRGMMGATDPTQADPGTVRGDLATAVTENLVHSSDSAASAAREIAIFFPGL